MARVITAHRRAVRPDSSAAIRGKYYLLDMGGEQYGDSVLCRFGSKTVLIDAGHPRDFEGQQGYESIPAQLEEILGPPPFALTLLVVTHAHNDHIGCLPNMIEAGLIKPQFALVADPDLGFPPGFRDIIDSVADLDPAMAIAIRRAMAGAAEEDHSFLPDAELDAFLDAISTLGSRYRTMLDTLSAGGTSIFKWGNSDADDLQPIYRALANTGFDIIGPSIPQLEICRDQIIAYARDVHDSLVSAVEQVHDSGPDTPRKVSSAALYRSAMGPLRASPQRFNALMSRGDVLIDRKGQGSAINCQSIVLTFGAGDEKVLLAADMQFGDSEVDDLEPEMNDLRAKVVAAGPYRFVKTTHHTSSNGIDIELWNDLGKPALLAHSGGLNDDKHPERGALNSFKELGDQIVFARTDRNGQIAVDPAKDDETAFTIARGKLNDFTPNQKQRRRDIAEQPVTTTTTTLALQPQPLTTFTELQHSPGVGEPAFVDLIFARIPYQDGRISIDGHVIEISARNAATPLVRNENRTVQPPPQGRVRGGATRPALAGDAAKLGGGRDMSGLLFVTDAAKLQKNVGELETRRALGIIEAGADCLRIDGHPQPATAVRNALGKGKHKGVVLVGGYDVVPSQRVDVLDPGLRASIPRKGIVEDHDEFVVWSDDMWGDVDGEGMPDLPVSRIPDARYPELLIKTIQASPPSDVGRFGIRNVVRPFASGIFELIPGNEKLIESAPTRYDQLPKGSAERPYMYFMLHGLDSDGSRFWGDNPGRGVVEAINTASLPRKGLGVVMAGCCWGALTVDQRARDVSGIISPKPPESSMALSALLGGALAFVGCTGVHYSPWGNGNFFGGPMHRAFWQELTGGKPPAEALFLARKQFLAGMPHGRSAPLEVGIERKIYKQFTCLGLGW